MIVGNVNGPNWITLQKLGKGPKFIFGNVGSGPKLIIVGNVVGPKFNSGKVGKGPN